MPDFLLTYRIVLVLIPHLVKKFSKLLVFAFLEFLIKVCYKTIFSLVDVNKNFILIANRFGRIMSVRSTQLEFVAQLAG